MVGQASQKGRMNMVEKCTKALCIAILIFTVAAEYL